MNNNNLVSDEPEVIAHIGDTLLEKGRIQDAVTYFERALKIQPSFLYAHNKIEKFGSNTWQSRFGFNCLIHPDDDIFRFFATHPTSINPIRDYLSDGWRTMLELIFILDDIEKPLRKCKTFLEYACGFGRFTRHLDVAIRKYGNNLIVSDVVPGSVDFLINNFGVKGFYSTLNPDELDIPGNYDLVFVLSLFTHLPENTWGRWIKKLYSALGEGGALIFTTHGEKVAKQKNVIIPDSGFLYELESESTALTGDHYGMSYTSKEFVRNTVLRETGQEVYREYFSHFWSSQDAYVVMRPCSLLTHLLQLFRHK